MNDSLIRYGKSALAGAGMSLLGLSLCGAKTAHWVWGTKRQFARDLKVIQSIPRNDSTIQYNDDTKTLYHKEHIYPFTLKQTKWTHGEGFLGNLITSVPIAVLGAVFHDYWGKDLTAKINSYFDTDISPYIVDAGVFGSVGFASVLPLVGKGVEMPWAIYYAGIQSLLIGITAGLGAYCGDKSDKKIDDLVEIQTDDNDINPLEQFEVDINN